jgi:hypothetical protein
VVFPSDGLNRGGFKAVTEFVRAISAGCGVSFEGDAVTAGREGAHAS